MRNTLRWLLPCLVIGCDAPDDEDVLADMEPIADQFLDSTDARFSNLTTLRPSEPLQPPPAAELDLTAAPHEANGPVETWADYSMMGQRRAAQIWAGNVLAAQYAWAPVTANESHIYWGDANNWPPEYHERLIREGDWVMLDGWWGNGTYYILRVTQEELCDGTCSNCTTLATSGRQHYVKWTVPETAYCLRARGTVTEEFSGKVLQFGHTQAYWPPAPCSNAYYSGQRCIRQWESWWDDNPKPYQRRVDRDQYLAKGIGQGFTVDQYFPSPWHAELRYYWNY